LAAPFQQFPHEPDDLFLFLGVFRLTHSHLSQHAKQKVVGPTKENETIPLSSEAQAFITASRFCALGCTDPCGGLRGLFLTGDIAYAPNASTCLVQINQQFHTMPTFLYLCRALSMQQIVTPGLCFLHHDLRQCLNVRSIAEMVLLEKNGVAWLRFQVTQATTQSLLENKEEALAYPCAILSLYQMLKHTSGATTIPFPCQQLGFFWTETLRDSAMFAGSLFSMLAVSPQEKTVYLKQVSHIFPTVTTNNMHCSLMLPDIQQQHTLCLSGQARMQPIETLSAELHGSVAHHVLAFQVQRAELQRADGTIEIV
jgi:hypothetical protein